MSELYELDLVKYSKEEKPKLKSFVNLDSNKLGLEVNWELGSFRFFIYKQKKKHQLMKSNWVRMKAEKDQLYKTLLVLIMRYYKFMDRLQSDGLPIYTQMELRSVVSHLHYHANADTLRKVLSKEVIYN